MLDISMAYGEERRKVSPPIRVPKGHAVEEADVARADPRPGVSPRRAQSRPRPTRPKILPEMRSMY